MPPQQPIQVPPASTTPPDPKSFRLYTGKAPLFVQIIGGLLWIGAAGGVLYTIGALITFNIVYAVVYGIGSAVIIMTAKSMFKQQKAAFRNTIILTVLYAVVAAYVAWSGHGFNPSGLILPVLSIMAVFIYRDRFVN